MAEPTNRKTNAAGGKYYDHPVTGERFDSVTTALDVVDKERLKIWAAGLAATEAFELLPLMNRSVLEPECGNSYNRCYLKHGKDTQCGRCPCGVCERCVHRRLKDKHFSESSRRANEGTEVHEAARFWVLNGGSEITLSEAAQPYWVQFKQWVSDYGLRPNDYPTDKTWDLQQDRGSWEQTETTILNRDHMYAGTCDAAVWFVRGATTLATQICDRLGGKDRVLVRIDYKTREKPKEELFRDHPLQLVGYDRCTVAMPDDGSEHELVQADACAVLQLRPGSYTFRLVRTDDETFAAFLACLTIYRWLEGPALPSMAPEAFPVVTGEQAVKLLERELGAQPIVPPPTKARFATDPPAWTDTATPDLSEWSDPWDETPAADPPWPPDDPFAAHTDPTQVQADTAATDTRVAKPVKKAAPRKVAAKKAAPSANSTIESLVNYDPGQPLVDRLTEPLPY